MVGRWAKKETRSLIEEYQSAGLISGTEEAELLRLVSEDKTSLAINTLLSLG